MMESVSGDRLWQWRQWACRRAEQGAIAPSEVDWLLRELAGLDALSLRLGSFRDRPTILLKRSLEDLTHLWEQRIESRIPVQYLVGRAPWRGFSLNVSPAVLIPRPETELLIDLAIAQAQRYPELQQGHWADLGTGSGAIALGLATAFPEAQIHAVDTSADALAIAQTNAVEHQLGDRIQFYQGDWFEPLNTLRGSFSGIVSNPPYIPSGDIPDLQPEVVRHEPHLALDGGTDGLDAVRRLIHDAPAFLKPGGLWLVELMAGQAEAVAALLQQHPYRDISIHTDLAGIDRFVLAHRL